MSQGITTKKRVSQLSTGHKTVENRRGNLMNKLDVHNKLELVKYAGQTGLMEIEFLAIKQEREKRQ
jgi:DNA-binding CsgD family transcriptional regulator